MVQQFLSLATERFEFFTGRLDALPTEVNLPERLELLLTDLARPAPAQIIREPVPVTMEDEMRTDDHARGRPRCVPEPH